MFKTINGGASWNEFSTGITDSFIYLSVLAIDVNNPSILYAGTRHLFSGSASGVLKSTNGGANWSQVNTGLTSTDVRALALDPKNSATVYAGTFGGGVFKSTNNGASWNQINTGLTNLRVLALVVDPRDPATLYAGTFGGGVFKSANNGASWVPFNNGLTNFSIQALAISNSGISLHAGTPGGGVFTYLYGGQGCTITCAASVPKSGSTGTPVSFIATYTTVGCTDSPTYDWDFGDGSAHSSQPNPKHTYTAAGTYTWTMTARLPGANPCTKTGTIVVSTSCTVLSITTQPISPIITSGQTATLSVAASGSAPLTYQWYRGFSGDTSDPINGATSSSYRTQPLTNTTSYWVRVENACGSAKSSTAQVTVNEPGKQGRLAQQATTPIPLVVHADFTKGLIDTGETTSREIWKRIYELLYTPIGQVGVGQFDYFPAYNPTGAPIESGACPESLLPEEKLEPAVVVSITPTPGTIVHPGDVVSINFTVTDGNGVEGILLTTDGRIQNIAGQGPFSYSYVVTSDRAGRVDISALTYGPGPENYSASTYIIVASSSAPTAISATPRSLLLGQVGDSFPLRVTGQFADGTQLDLTSSTAGTSYAVQSGTNNIVSVSSEGMVEARGIGQDTILISNSGKTVAVKVYVFPDGVIPNSNLTSVSAASYDSLQLAPEAIVAAFGTGLATATLAASSIPLPTSLAGTTVRVRDSTGTERLAPLFFASPTQINYQMPLGVTPGAATVTVDRRTDFPAIGTVQIAPVAPGLFAADASGRGVAAGVVLRVRADGSQSYEPLARFDPAQNRFVAVPIDLGPPTDQVFLILYGTGIRYRSSISAVTSKIGGVDAQVLYAGAQGGFVGLDQVNLRVPRSLIGRGEIDITLTVDGKAANTIKASIK